jgi:hypothetical protein
VRVEDTLRAVFRTTVRCESVSERCVACLKSKESKVVSVHTTKTYRRNRSMGPFAFILALQGGVGLTSHPGYFVSEK